MTTVSATLSQFHWSYLSDCMLQQNFSRVAATLHWRSHSVNLKSCHGIEKDYENDMHCCALILLICAQLQHHVALNCRSFTCWSLIWRLLFCSILGAPVWDANSINSRNHRSCGWCFCGEFLASKHMGSRQIDCPWLEIYIIGASEQFLFYMIVWHSILGNQSHVHYHLQTEWRYQQRRILPLLPSHRWLLM